MMNPFGQLGELKKMRDQAMQIQKTLQAEEIQVEKNGVSIKITGDQNIKELSSNGRSDNDIKEALFYWSQAVGIPLAQFQQTQVDTRVGKKVSKRGKLPFGTAHLSIKSMGNKDFGVFLARKINAWIDEVF